MIPVTGLARLAGGILPFVRMGNFSLVYCYYGKFQLGYRDEQGAIFQALFHPGNRAGVFIWETF